MRRAAHVDATQAAIVAALRAIHATVQSLAPVGNGCPDLLVGYKGRTYLLEVKSPAEVAHPSKFARAHKGLNEVQESWHWNWRGRPVAIVTTPEEALAAVAQP